MVNLPGLPELVAAQLGARIPLRHGEVLGGAHVIGIQHLGADPPGPAQPQRLQPIAHVGLSGGVKGVVGGQQHIRIDKNNGAGSIERASHFEHSALGRPCRRN